MKITIIAIFIILALVIALFFLKIKFTPPIEKKEESKEAALQRQKQAKQPALKQKEKEPEIIVKNGKEWKRDKFGRLILQAPEPRKQPDKAKIIKDIEAQKDAPQIPNEWIISRKAINSKGEEITKDEVKVFAKGESFAEQFAAMKEILAQDDVVYVEPNYIYEIPRPKDNSELLKSGTVR